jgi:hypothetical protein
VALEYIIPEEFVDSDGPPVLFGQTMHHHSYLPMYILHVWMWKWNPSGLFADFNQRVRGCPSSYSSGLAGGVSFSRTLPLLHG